MKAAGIAALAATVFLSGPTDAAIASSHRCGMPHARIVAHAALTVVLKDGETYWGCVWRRGIKRPLASDTGQTIKGHFRVKSGYVAFEREDGCYDGCLRMVSMNVLSGRRLVSYGVNAGRDGAPVLRVVLDSGGRLAWIRQAATLEVHQMTSNGDETLDASDSIEPGSLRIAGNRVFWRHAGETRSSALDAYAACAARNSATLARTAEVRVYWAMNRTYETTGNVVGCDLASHRRTVLGTQELDSFEYFGGGHVHAAGHFASIDKGRGGRGGASAALFVYDVTTGRVIHRWECCGGDFGLMEAVVLHPSGSVAWIAGESDASSSRVEVRKSDANGESVLVDSAPFSPPAGIDGTSLALAGTTLTWKHDGQLRSAELR